MSFAAPSPCSVRDFRTTDLPELHRIDRECFPPSIAYSRIELFFYIRYPLSFTRVAEKDGVIVGFAVGRITRDRAGHVITIDVLPSARRRKVGTALMNSLHNVFAQRGISKIHLEVSVENAAALRFYEMFGYERSERLTGYYNGVLDAYRMTRSIA